MLRTITLSICLALAALCGSVHAGAFAFDDGTTRVVMIDGSSANDVCELKFTDDDDDDLISAGQVEVKLNGEEYEFEATAGSHQRLYVIFRGWNGNDTLEADSVALDFPEFFFIYFDGGNHHDTLDNQTAIDCKARGGSGEDILMGGSGDDDLSGGDDFDILVGGAGNDDLSDAYDGHQDEFYGGPGADHFGLVIWARNRTGRGYTLIDSNDFMDYNWLAGDTYRVVNTYRVVIR